MGSHPMELASVNSRVSTDGSRRTDLASVNGRVSCDGQLSHGAGFSQW